MLQLLLKIIQQSCHRVGCKHVHCVDNKVISKSDKAEIIEHENNNALLMIVLLDYCLRYFQ